jgi:opacity protein-like surface antigen
MENFMKTRFAAALLAPLAFAAPQAFAADIIDDVPAPARADDNGGVKIGTLRCEIGGGLGYVLGSAKEVDCAFHSRDGFVENYNGVIRKLGIDVGYTRRSKLVWAVFAPTAGNHHGSLAGRYRGATAEATAIFGVGANVLVGGTTGSVHLQLLSLTGQRGINIAATGTSMTLKAAD